MTSVINKEFWCPRVRLYFDLFVKNPTSLQHLLLFGPPGSGKTTSAEWLVSQIWKQQKALMCISMNAADERSLEAIRQKIFPFLRASWSSIQVSSQVAPRFIILDECETLTEAAQLSLQTILDRDPKDVCMILICNSQSRIHPKLRQRLLRIRYDPSTQKNGSGEATLPPSQRTAFQEISRGDLRLSLKKSETDARLEFYLNHHPDQIPEFLRTNSAELSTILTELLLLANTLYLLDKDLLEQINRCMPLLNAGVEWTRCYALVGGLIQSIQQKFEASLKTEGH
jgi:DNA polymerase III delta prime subunit